MKSNDLLSDMGLSDIDAYLQQENMGQLVKELMSSGQDGSLYGTVQTQNYYIQMTPE